MGPQKEFGKAAVEGDEGEITKAKRTDPRKMPQNMDHQSPLLFHRWEI